MSVKAYTRSFAGGEISEQLFGRLDLVKFQTGLAKCLNFRIVPQGPAENRAGFAYVNTAKHGDKRCVLIPFAFSTEQTFALEFGDQYIRFHTMGATLLEAGLSVTGISQASPGVVSYSGADPSSGQQFYLSGIGGMTPLNGRYVLAMNVDPIGNTFEVYDLFGAPIDTSAMAAWTSGGAASRVYEIATPYAEAELLDLHYVQSADVLTIVHPNHEPRELRRLGATNWQLDVISFVPTIAAPGVPAAVAGGPGGGTPTTYSYVVTAIAADSLEESLPSPSDSAAVDMSVSGNYIDVTPATVVGAIRYNVYRLTSGLYGFVGQTDGSAFRDQNITPDLLKTPPMSNDPFVGSGNYPGAVSYFEQRRAFGGSNNKPQTIWLTRSGTEQNMGYSIPTQDDDAITARIVAREAQRVRHLVPLNDLLAPTSGGVWRISSSNSDILTPATTSIRPQGYTGASNAQPAVTSRSILYVADRGAHMREVSYRWESQSYESEDVSVLAPHLFDYQSVLQITYAKAPIQTLWAVRGDGVLLGMTHVPEQEVKAWHQHSTKGWFESVVSIAEGTEDGLYVSVRRTINGQTVRYIERQASRDFATQAEAFFVDAGATYSGIPVGEVSSGLWHLEGEEVAILADGGVSPSQVVTNGSVSLDAPASKIHVGLGYESDLQTMPVSFESQALGQGLRKNVNKIDVRVYRSLGLRAGPTFSKLREYPTRPQSANYGEPPPLETDVLRLTLDPDWQENGSVCLRQNYPLPLSVLSMTMEVASGG